MADKPRWPLNQETRFCNLGDCPAWHLEPEDVDYLNTTTKMIMIDKIPIEKVVSEKGLPQGTCLAKSIRRLAGSKCNVSDADFKEYFNQD